MKATQDEVFKGVALTSGRGRPRGQEGEDRVLISCKEQLLDRLLESIRDRFKDGNSDILVATKLVNFRNWPQSTEGEAGGFIRSSSVERTTKSIKTSLPVYHKVLKHYLFISFRFW